MKYPVQIDSKWNNVRNFAILMKRLNRYTVCSTPPKLRLTGIELVRTKGDLYLLYIN